MGNSNSNESDAVKRQAEGAGGCKEMYELLNLQGGGSLLPITKRAMIKNDFKELDDTIKSKILPFLYKKGAGQMIPIAHLTMLRNKIRGIKKQFQIIKDLGDKAMDFVFEGSELLEDVTKGLDPELSPELFRECCWNVEKRGSVGETVFHICFLLQTPTHLVLARRLLKWYPKLLNDIYLSDDYYGENVLHMSVTAEYPTMVKYLLDQGVDIHERCIGSFFSPEDQKSSRTDSLHSELVNVNPKTNYAGYVYWGEYSLSFAAVLSQEECYRLILSRGADHDLADTNGNTVTHIMVIHNNWRMFDIAVECGASISIKNNLNMTPLATAAYLALQDMFFHIANIEREVYWQIGNVCCSAYPIEQLDSINSDTGELNMQSALNLIVFGHLTEHLDLIEGVVVDLLQTKWKSFIKRTFLRKLYIYIGYLVTSSFCFISRGYIQMREYHSESDSPSSDNHNQEKRQVQADVTMFNVDEITGGVNKSIQTRDLVTPELLSTIAPNLSSYETLPIPQAVVRKSVRAASGSDDDLIMKLMDKPLKCHDNFFNMLINFNKEHVDFLALGVSFFEIVLVIWSVYYIVNAIKEVSFLGAKMFLKTLVLCPSRVMFLIACCLVVISIPFRLACIPSVENRMAIVIMLFTSTYALFFCRAFKTTGPFVIMIYRMMAADMIRFATIYFIFAMGFSQAYYVSFQSYDGKSHPMETPMDSLISIFLMSLGSFSLVWDELDDTNHALAGKFQTFLFLAIVAVLLVNLLIAMMADTYTRIAEIKNEWMRQWARTVLIVERSIPPLERHRQQDLYSERMMSGEKAMVMKQTMTDEKLREIQDITEMKISHRRNIIKRKKKFGFESKSTIGLNLASTLSKQVDDEDESGNLM